jgi:single-strand selective monofunctional uracil DNA glycosylase
VSHVETDLPERLLREARRLANALDCLKFTSPVTHTYNPLTYAWPCYEAYVRRFATTPKRVVFLGMNPGPFGMVQTGIPFGEVTIVRKWLGIEALVRAPEKQHPRRPITGFACHRSEVSGRRLWGLFVERFTSPERFFARHIVLNYCPLAFIEESGRNRTPDKLSTSEKQAVFEACDQHLREAIAVLKPEWLIGIGEFAFGRATEVFPNNKIKLGKIPHPSPANPAANRNWAEVASRKLETLGIWQERRRLAGVLQVGELPTSPARRRRSQSRRSQANSAVA